ISQRTPRLVTALIAVAIGAPYLFYRPYDQWETLRFLLPLIALASIVASAGLLATVRALIKPPFALTVVALIAVLTAAFWMAWLSANQVFMLEDSEARHRVAGELATDTTPDAA